MMFVALSVEMATFCQNIEGNSKHERGWLGAMVVRWLGGKAMNYFLLL